LIDLRPGLPAVRSQYSKTQRQGIRTAERAGVTVRTASSIDDWRTYYALYHESMARWGNSATSNHPWALFESLHRRQDESLQLWLAEIGGEACAGAVVLYTNSIGCYFHGASSERYAKQMASKLLQDRIMEELCSRGLTTYDLLSSGNHEGVAKFKASLGSKLVEFAYFDWRCAVSSRLRFFARRQSRNILKLTKPTL
jgi:lipid II:glycine glycyltransferase (peptidoglycan interpeptide bridge formation enzyme)